MSRSAHGCLYVLVLLIGSCIVCPHTDAWERFNGSTLWQGTNLLQVTGDTTFEWKGGLASVARIAAMAAPDGYWIELHGPGEHMLLGLQTQRRPHEGTFRVVRSPVGHQPAGAVYLALLTLSNDGTREFASDSGRLTLRESGKGLNGSCVVYMTETFPSDSIKPRHLVARATFELQ